MNRKNPAYGYSNDVVTGVACFTVSDGDLVAAPSATFPKISNLALSSTHPGVGQYTLTLLDGGPQCLDIVPTVVGVAAQASAVDYDPSTRTPVSRLATPPGCSLTWPSWSNPVACIMRTPPPSMMPLDADAPSGLWVAASALVWGCSDDLLAHPLQLRPLARRMQITDGGVCFHGPHASRAQ
jgi:hypothetical protein